MKALNEYIYESLLDDEDAIAGDFVENVRNSITKYLEDNYKLSGRIDISEKPNNDGKFVVDVKGRAIVATRVKKLTNEYFVFGSVQQYFDCSSSQIEDLEGAPREVGEDFICSICNNLKDLKGAPKIVGRDFVCRDCNNLKDLKGAPEVVGRDFRCSGCNNLKDLKGAPKIVGRDFICNFCDRLKDLKGAPEVVDGDFRCGFCDRLSSLEGSPREVGGDFICSSCVKLISLVGAPHHIKGNFYCDKLNINSLRGFPKRVNGNVLAYEIGFAREQIKDVCQVGGRIAVV